MIGEVNSLHPAFKLAIDRIMDGMRAKGWDPVIGSGMRTTEQQNALYAQGRRPTTEVNALRAGARLPAITPAANRSTVTNARGGQSNHNLTTFMSRASQSTVNMANGYAVDIVDRQLKWEALPLFWVHLGELTKKYGCAWGGDWKKPDPAHVEMKLIDSASRASIVV